MYDTVKRSSLFRTSINPGTPLNHIRIRTDTYTCNLSLCISITFFSDVYHLISKSSGDEPVSKSVVYAWTPEFNYRVPAVSIEGSQLHLIFGIKYMDSDESIRVLRVMLRERQNFCTGETMSPTPTVWYWCLSTHDHVHLLIWEAGKSGHVFMCINWTVYISVPCLCMVDNNWRSAYLPLWPVRRVTYFTS